MGLIVLSGFPGSGKTTVGPLVASRLGVRWVDTDAELVRRTGVPVAELWRSHGEAHFRELEGALLRELLADAAVGVISLGGGAVTVREVRHLLLDRAFLVTLRAEPSTLLRRLGDLRARPHLVASDPLSRVTTLLAERASLYAECHLALATDSMSPETAADRIVRAAAEENRVVVALGSRSYPVDVVTDRPLTLARALGDLSPSTLVVVTDENVVAARKTALDAAVLPVNAPGRARHASFGRGPQDPRERASHLGRRDRKGRSRRRRARIRWRRRRRPRGIRRFDDAARGAGRPGSHVSAGDGGRVRWGQDWLRPPRWQEPRGDVPPTSAVVVDLEHLTTLPRPDFLSGLAEVAKTALACDPEMWAFVDTHAERLAAGDAATLRPMVLRSIALKARIVRDDESDTGQRALLNLGHTVGHALETAGGVTRATGTGEAVAIGLVLECRVAERLGLAPAGLARQVADVLTRLCLPTVASRDELASAAPLLARDKKRAGEGVLLPLPTGLGIATLKTVSLRDVAAAMTDTHAR